jgi:hypothetical protein
MPITLVYYCHILYLQIKAVNAMDHCKLIDPPYTFKNFLELTDYF